MKTGLILLSIYFSWFLVLPCQAGEPWDETAKKVLSLAGQMDERSRSSHRFVGQDRAALEQKIAALKKSIRDNTKALDQATGTLNRLSAQRAALADQYQRETADMKTVKGSFRAALGRTLSRFDASPVASVYPEKRQGLRALLEQEEFPGLEQLQAYSEIVFSDIRATGTIEVKSAPVIGSSGQVKDVDLFRAGGFFLGYRDDDHSYFVLPQAGGPGMSVKATGALKRDLAEWFAGNSELLPLDITDGTAIRATEQHQRMDTWVEAGGVLVYPILGAGLVGALVAVLKALQLLIQKPMGRRKKQQLFEDDPSLDRMGDLLVKIKRCPGARVIAAGLESQVRTIDSLDNLIEQRIMVEQGRQERFLSIIGVLASIAPLLGLLGTVTGMIDTFRAITIFGTSDPRMMSTGISEALVTTQAGLAIAIPLLLAHHFLKRRVALLVADMEECGMAVIARLTAG